MLSHNKFELKELTKQQRIVAENPLATVISAAENKEAGIDVHHIPLYWHSDSKENHFLRGHIAHINPMWQQLSDSHKTLCVFHGPQAYITPNWYPTKKQHGKAVPTWNYIVVHVKGEMRFIHDEKYKREILSTQTDILESGIETQQKEPWKITDAPESYIKKMLGGIVGVEIAIESIQAQAKLSQNQPQCNYDNVINGLNTSKQNDALKLAKLMKENF